MEKRWDIDTTGGMYSANKQSSTELGYSGISHNPHRLHTDRRDVFQQIDHLLLVILKASSKSEWQSDLRSESDCQSDLRRASTRLFYRL
jgi:hypothetical protein